MGTDALLPEGVRRIRHRSEKRCLRRFIQGIRASRYELRLKAGACVRLNWPGVRRTSSLSKRGTLLLVSQRGVAAASADLGGEEVRVSSTLSVRRDPYHPVC